MSDQNTPPQQAAKRDALDISDFVYAATGARVRRLTLPNREHWFPAVDVCDQLAHTNPTEALRRHVPRAMRSSLQTLISREGLSIPAGQGLKRSMSMVSLNGLIRLVNGSVKRECEPFKNWVAEVVVAVQQDGSYALEKAEVQPALASSAPIAYAMPKEVADAIVRLEEHNLHMDEEHLATQREIVRSKRESVRSQQGIARSLARIADTLEGVSRVAIPHQRQEPPRPTVTADSVLADWRAQLTITDDVWAVAVYLVPTLVEHGEARYTLEAIASRTGLTVSRVHDSLRFLLKRGCIRQTNATTDGTPVYVLKRP